jgi:hypothetical protein
MLTLDLDFGLNTNVETQEILHLLNKKKGGFLLLRAESYEFSSNSVVLPGFSPN